MFLNHRFFSIHRSIVSFEQFVFKKYFIWIQSAHINTMERNNSLNYLLCYLVDPASSHMLVSKIKPCMSKYKSGSR